MKRFKHSLSHYKLLTCNMGQLIPCGCVEVLPGDTFQHRTSALIRVSPLLAPVMHPVQARIHHFFVPNRLVWDGWEDFITGEIDETTYPRVTVPDTVDGRIYDYLGVPPVTGLVFGSLALRSYNKIYNEWYRDQDLAPERTEDQTGVPLVAWEKDYLTSARPWPQKGDDVTLPVGSQAPIVGIGKTDQAYNSLPGAVVYETQGTGTEAYASSDKADTGSWEIEEDENNPGFPGIYADLTKVTAVNVNEVRRAFALQRYQEARARYGSRYTEYLAYLGIRSSDARLQRPEYLGGGKQTISFSEVLQTAPEAADSSVVGDLKGHGIAGVKGNRYRRFFEEHGHVISMLSVRPKAMYTDSLHRKFMRRDKEDYFQKELEAIGQQEIFNGEVLAGEQGSGGSYATWGFADRYREYREEQSHVCDEFRNLLNYWHLSREFATLPTLNSSFTDCNPSKRIHAEQTQKSLWVMVNHSIQARRMVNKSAAARII